MLRRRRITALASRKPVPMDDQRIPRHTTRLLRVEPAPLRLTISLILLCVAFVGSMVLLILVGAATHCPSGEYEKGFRLHSPGRVDD